MGSPLLGVIFQAEERGAPPKLFVVEPKAKYDAAASRTLLDAAREGRFGSLAAALQAGADINFHGYDGPTLLHWAAYHGDDQMVIYLIAKGAEVNAKTTYKRTPLHWAAMQGQWLAANALIQNGADLAARDRADELPISLAARRGDESFKRTQELLANAVPLNNELDADGRTQLHIAAMSGRRYACEVLIMRGADLNPRDKQGRTPLHAAVSLDRAEVVALLLRQGADPNIVDPYGLTPLFEARALRVARVLLDKGAKVDARDKTGQTPLHWAAAYGRKDVAQLLIAKGADVNARDKFGRTPADVDREEGHGALAGVWGARP